MISKIKIIPRNTATTTLIYKSDKYRGDGYYGNSDGLHTVMYTATPSFHGTITMQASLASDPVESDWFTVSNTSVNYTPLNSRSTSTVDYFNFTGNFVWVRGHIAINAGAVQAIEYNH
jgi:hypothetical protein